MRKYAFAFMILMLCTYFFSKAVTDIVDPSESTQRELYFAKVLNYVRQDINYRVSKIVRSMMTFPATISNNFDKVSEFMNTFIELTGEIDELDIKLRFQLYTPVNPYKKYLLELNQESFYYSKFNSSLETKFIIHGFREVLTKNSIIYDIKDQLFQQGNYNIIIVDWTNYSRAPHETAAENVAFIGYEVARLIKVLIYYIGLSPESFHLIAHSLGCHVAGSAGKMIPNLGRITSLDATGQIFDDLPSCLKITNTDAEFVDAIHTHGSSSYSAGLGTLFPYGDIDFFPNGGSVQPGCSFGKVYVDTNKKARLVNTDLEFIFCNHQRALFLFLESINECWFESVICSGYSDFKNGKCPRETSLVSRMGFHAKKIEDLPENIPFYLETNDKFPFCFENV